MDTRASEGFAWNFTGTGSWRRYRRRFGFALGLLVAAGVLAPAVIAQTPPPNDNFVNAISIGSSNITAAGCNDYATKEPGEPDHAGNPGGKSVWWTWQAPGTGYVTLTTHGSSSDTWQGWPLESLLAVYTGSPVSSLTEVASNDEDPATYDGTSRLGFKTSPGTQYQIAVDGYTYDTRSDADSGTIRLSLVYSALATNDDFAHATPFVGNNCGVPGNNDCATKEPGEPDHAGDPGGKSIWWTWQAPTTGFVTIWVQGTNSQTADSMYALLAVYLGDSVSNLTEVASTSGDSGNWISVTFRADAGKLYRIAVDGGSDDYATPSDAESGNVTLWVSFSAGLPIAPAWGPIPDIYGEMVSSTDFAGKVVLLNFWATWCPACVYELPDLVALYQKYASDGLVVVGVSLDASPDGVNPPTALVSSFASSQGMTYPVLTDRPSWWEIEYDYGGNGGISWIPTTYVINRQNRVYQEFVGAQTFSTFEQTVLPLLDTDLAVNLKISGGIAHLSWPLTPAAFVVESTTNLAGGVWTQAGMQPQSSGTEQFVDLPVGPGRQFFRLRSQ